MKHLRLLVAVLCVSGPLPGQRARKPDVEIAETRARREQGRILVDVRVKTTGEKPLRGLVVYFDLMSPENGVVASHKSILDEEIVEPGQERSSQSVAGETARAVRYKIRVFDFGERELRVANAGPFPIE